MYLLLGVVSQVTKRFFNVASDSGIPAETCTSRLAGHSLVFLLMAFTVTMRPVPHIPLWMSQSTHQWLLHFLSKYIEFVKTKRCCYNTLPEIWRGANSCSRSLKRNTPNTQEFIRRPQCIHRLTVFMSVRPFVIIHRETSKPPNGFPRN